MAAGIRTGFGARRHARCRANVASSEGALELASSAPMANILRSIKLAQALVLFSQGVLVPYFLLRK